MDVTCFVAICDDDPANPVAVEVSQQLDPSSKLPASEGRLPQLVIGTLDVNTGISGRLCRF